MGPGILVLFLLPIVSVYLTTASFLYLGAATAPRPRGLWIAAFAALPGGLIAFAIALAPPVAAYGAMLYSVFTIPLSILAWIAFIFGRKALANRKASHGLIATATAAFALAFLMWRVITAE